MAANSSDGIAVVVAELRDAMGLDADVSPGCAADSREKRLQVVTPGVQWNPIRDIAMFTTNSGDRVVECAISLEALRDHFGDEKHHPLVIFGNNRERIEQLAARLIAQKRFESDGSVLIRTADVR